MAFLPYRYLPKLCKVVFSTKPTIFKKGLRIRVLQEKEPSYFVNHETGYPGC